jgi:hypothetical protein
MVHFPTSVSWSTIKSFKHPYFAWLCTNRVYLNYTKFKTDTLVACGFLVGAHPGYLCREEAEEEIRGSLGLDEGELQFQLSSRSVSVPIKDGQPSRYNFHAVILKTSVREASRLRELFYALQHPKKAKTDYPYTGSYQFVPMLKSKEWSVEKICQLAQLHTSIMEDLNPIYIQNLHDINSLINDQGKSIKHFLQKMEANPDTEISGATTLIHSVHNTRQSTTKVTLVRSSHYDEELGKLTNLQNILSNTIMPDFLKHILVPGLAPTVSGPCEVIAG